MFPFFLLIIFIIFHFCISSFTNSTGISKFYLLVGYSYTVPAFLNFIFTFSKLLYFHQIFFVFSNDRTVCKLSRIALVNIFVLYFFFVSHFWIEMPHIHQRKVNLTSLIYACWSCSLNKLWGCDLCIGFPLNEFSDPLSTLPSWSLANLCRQASFWKHLKGYR